MRALMSAFIAAVCAACAAPADPARSGPQVPLDLWPRVLAHAAAEELRKPDRVCEARARDKAWIALSERLRASDRALRGGPPAEHGLASDAAITALLRAELDHRVWAEPCALGDRASKDLWFVVQHSPDRSLLREGLAFFESAAAYGFTPYSQVATMRDRTRMQAGEDQVFGTQYVCDGETGRRVRWPVEDEAGLDERRARAGLIPASWELRIMNHGRAPCA